MVGKPIGVVLGSRLAVRARIADPPEGTSKRQLLGVGQAAGIGFTVALFVTELAFHDPAHEPTPSSPSSSARWSPPRSPH